MTDGRDGRSFSVPPCRRLTWDLLWFNRSVPLCGHDRVMSLAPLAAARSSASVRISWPALFLKAYSLAAQDIPELRQTWYRWPLAHLYQHPHSVGTLTVQREVKGEPWLFWGLIDQPENLSLTEIQGQIDRWVQAPVREVFRRQQKLARLPTVLRRLIWRWNLHVAKAGRASRLGTFFLSTLSGRGVEIQVPPSIHTGCLTYGPLNEDGRTRVTLAYDHRIMDGARAAECLIRLEQLLLEKLSQELLQVCPQDAKIPHAA
ncbi:MAG: hypothetical protein R3C49_01575 [Planctomycetaceae bacterium]